MKYVLKGDILEYNYQIFGIYSNVNNLLEAATKIIKHNLETIEMAQQQYDFSGLTYFPFSTIDNDPTQATEEFPIYWDTQYHEADIKNEGWLYDNNY